MKKLAIVAVGLVLCGAACSKDKVDRDGTRDLIVEAYQQQGVTADSDCIDGVLDGYSDDELKSMDDAMSKGQPNADTDALYLALDSCVTGS